MASLSSLLPSLKSASRPKSACWLMTSTRASSFSALGMNACQHTGSYSALVLRRDARTPILGSLKFRVSSMHRGAAWPVACSNHRSMARAAVRLASRMLWVMALIIASSRQRALCAAAAAPPGACLSAAPPSRRVWRWGWGCDAAGTPGTSPAAPCAHTCTRSAVSAMLLSRV